MYTIYIDYYWLVYPIGINIFPIGYSLFPIGYSLSARPGPGPAPPDLLGPLCGALGGRPPRPFGRTAPRPQQIGRDRARARPRRWGIGNRE